MMLRCEAKIKNEWSLYITGVGEQKKTVELHSNKHFLLVACENILNIKQKN